ncbi:MAG: hypothetical protein PHU85_08510 [Phycisphaerae bacterium]|nr:hypothetical protein [Phycisphaerae bacterium]
MFRQFTQTTPLSEEYNDAVTATIVYLNKQKLAAGYRPPTPSPR